MAKPTEKFTWATGGGAVVTEPLDAQKAAGFLAGAGNKPRASWFNYLFKTIGQWMDYTDALPTELGSVEAITWALKQIFSQGLTATTTAENTDAALNVTGFPSGGAGGNSYRLVFKAPIGGNRYFRCYVNTAGYVDFTINAEMRYTGGVNNWYGDAAADAVILSLSDAAGIVYTRGAALANTLWAAPAAKWNLGNSGGFSGTNTISTTAGVSAASVSTSGAVAAGGAVTAGAHSSIPSLNMLTEIGAAGGVNNFPSKNYVDGLIIPRAFVRSSRTSPGSTVIAESGNLDMVMGNTNPMICIGNIGWNMLDTNYALWCWGWDHTSGQSIHARCDSRTIGGFQLTIYKRDGTGLDGNSCNAELNVLVMGRAAVS